MPTNLSHRLSQLSLLQLALSAGILALIALLLNLGRVAFIGDEAIRALVALEMKHSGDYLVPTLNGIAYYNKPPLYNWILVAVSSAWGHFGEWPSRVTTVFFLVLYAITVYFFSQKHFSKTTSFLLALMLITSGRILFWDSMLGLIDICFSWIIFLQWMLLYQYGSRNQWTKAFIWSYALFALAFLLKGLPAVMFQLFSVLATLIFFKSLRKDLFSFRHILGFITGLIVLSAYYIPYASEVAIDRVLAVLLDQSMQRTATHHGIVSTMIHLFTFPFEQLYHFLPWSLLGLVFFHPAARKWIRENEFVRFNIWMLLANIPVYWISVEVYPRYLLMFIPAFNVAGVYVFEKIKSGSAVFCRVSHIGLGVLCIAFCLIILLMPLDERARQALWFWPAWLLSLCLLFLTAAGYLKDHPRMLIWLAIALLIVRIMFDIVVLPDRQITFRENKCKTDCIRIAKVYGQFPWYVYGDTEIHQVARFYTAKYTDGIVLKTDTVREMNALYFVDRQRYPEFKGFTIDSLLLETNEYIPLMKPAVRDTSSYQLHETE